VEKDTDDLSQAKVVLAAEQAELARELEKLFQAYDEKVIDLASRVRSLPPDASRAEVDNIREIQRELQLVVRRLESAVKSRQELEKELVQWREREGGKTREREVARRRAEIIRSELALRDETEGWPVRLSPVGVDYRPLSKCGPFVQRMGEAEQAGDSSEMLADDMTFMDEDQLVMAIREATHEAERWHAIPVEDHDEEALLQVHHVRELNALLKQLDRQRGVHRDRIEIAINPRRVE